MATQTPPEGTIPVSQAMNMTANWRLYLNANTSEGDYQVRSYLIPIISLQNLLANNPDAESVRAYIGLNDVNDIDTTQLLFIPIVNGKEKPYRQIASANLVAEDDCTTDDCTNIYDLNVPCPPDCGTGNPPGSISLDS